MLESTDPFPGVYQIKAIGEADDDFEGRVVEAVVAEPVTPSELDYSVRATPNGRHVALTLDITVQTADQVRAVMPGSATSRGSRSSSERTSATSPIPASPRGGLTADREGP